MKIKKILSNIEVVVAEIEMSMHAGKDIQKGVVLGSIIKDTKGDKFVPLNTPDGRPIFLNEENAVDID